MLRRVLSSPLLYCGWAVVVVLALVFTYPVDPYLYGFTALGLAWLTGAVAILAVAALGFWGWEWTWGRRLLVVAGVAVAVAAVARALAILQTFKWA
ncbi:MAG TPA: hypothetical protein VFD69_00225 [Vicinamibacterales bacterium]|nr:hypothetical protein [Vicinamibacterales bacterium]